MTRKLPKANCGLRIAFIGMSNIGKSYTAQRIAKADNFQCYDVDARIQAKLGKTNMNAMAEWMGHPFTAGYAAKSSEYLNLEAELPLAAGYGEENLIWIQQAVLSRFAGTQNKTIRKIGRYHY